jgi:hypothetical protein
VYVQRLRDGWTMSPDPGNDGLGRGWDGRPDAAARPAPVPGIIQQVVPGYHGVAWYWRRFASPPGPTSDRVLLSFEHATYAATVWLNGAELGTHEGDRSPFTFDITDHLERSQQNLLAVRVVNATAEPIDGYVLAEVPHANARSADSYAPGSGLNVGGLLGDVIVHLVPPVRIADVFVRSDLGSGVVIIETVVTGADGAGSALRLSACLREVGSGLVGGRAEAALGVSGGDTVRLRVAVADPRPWDVDDPFLYLVQTRLESEDGAVLDEALVRTGFRQLRIENGYFSLNGRRLFLRSTHTGNHYPIGQRVPPTPAFVRQDLLYAKASGFNTVRFLSGPAREEQLDFCDEIGLMVYEEATASWLLGDSPKMAERYDRSVGDMIRRDRNHPSVVIWGLLNETYDGPVFRHAVQYLQTLRQLDDTRLVLLNSGRWDGDLAVGSVANPGDACWSHAWGAEEGGAPRAAVGWEGDPDRGAHVDGAGDVHLYPRLPESDRARQILRGLGRATKPVFLSEYGVGSMFDAIGEGAQAARWVGDVVPPDVAYIRSMAGRFEQDFSRFGMESMYCFPEDVVWDSYKNQSRHRVTTFDLIRANGAIAGYNLTGMLDHALTGEGSWTFWRRWKPGAMEALDPGWSPLRWCLDIVPKVAYQGDEVTVELALANEDILPPASYFVRLAVLGPGGHRQERSAVVEVGAGGRGNGPLAVPVLRERVPLAGPPGEYRFAASMGSAASPAAGRAAVTAIVPPTPLEPALRAVGIGVDAATRRWLAAHGVECRPPAGDEDRVGVLLIGPGEQSGETWTQVARALRSGAVAVVLAPGAFLAPGRREARFPFSQQISVSAFHDWLYHKECFAKEHALFDNLPRPGLMRWDVYGDVLPSHLVQGEAVDIAAFAVAIGYPVPTGYASGLVAAAIPLGAGTVLVSSFDLVGKVGTVAVADHLMINLLRWAARTRAGMPGGSPGAGPCAGEIVEAPEGTARERSSKLAWQSVRLGVNCQLLWRFGDGWHANGRARRRADRSASEHPRAAATRCLDPKRG